MPSGIDTPYDMPATTSRGFGLLLRIRVWSRQAKLDSALARGIDPGTSKS